MLFNQETVKESRSDWKRKTKKKITISLGIVGPGTPGPP